MLSLLFSERPCVRLLRLNQTDKKTGEKMKKKPTFCRSGDVITVRIQSEYPIAVEVSFAPLTLTLYPYDSCSYF
jgi:hypothetical protein